MKIGIASKQKFLMSSLVACAMKLLILPASGSVIFTDNFDGTAGSTPDPNIWNSQLVTQDGSGLAVFFRESTGSPVARLTGKEPYLFQPTETEYAKLTFTMVDTISNSSLGLFETTPLFNRISVGNDYGTGFWTITVQSELNVGFRSLAVSTAIVTGTWTMEWYTDKILLYLDDALVFNSLTDLPTGGDLSAWYLPTVSLVPDFQTYSPPGNSLNLSSVSWESVAIPEPSTVAMLSFAALSLLMLANRKGRGQAGSC